MLPVIAGALASDRGFGHLPDALAEILLLQPRRCPVLRPGWVHEGSMLLKKLYV